jgi:hypothetical protein
MLRAMKARTMSLNASCSLVKMSRCNPADPLARSGFRWFRGRPELMQSGPAGVSAR